MAIKQETQKMKPLKVVHLNASSAGGAFVAAQRLSEALNQRPDIDSEHWAMGARAYIKNNHPQLE